MISLFSLIFSQFFFIFYYKNSLPSCAIPLNSHNQKLIHKTYNFFSFLHFCCCFFPLFIYLFLYFSKNVKRRKNYSFYLSSFSFYLLLNSGINRFNLCRCIKDTERKCWYVYNKEIMMYRLFYFWWIGFNICKRIVVCTTVYYYYYYYFK